MNSALTILSTGVVTGGFFTLVYFLWTNSISQAQRQLIYERTISVINTLQLLVRGQLRRKIDFTDEDWTQCIKDHFQNGYCSGRLRVIETDPHCDEVIDRTELAIVSWRERFERDISDSLIANTWLAYLENVRNFGLNIGYLAELRGEGRELWWDRYKEAVYAGNWDAIESYFRSDRPGNIYDEDDSSNESCESDDTSADDSSDDSSDDSDSSEGSTSSDDSVPGPRSQANMRGDPPPSYEAEASGSSTSGEEGSD